MKSKAERLASDLTEAQSHLTYFRNQRMATEYAIRKLTEDLRLCNKQVKVWEERLAKMEGKARA